jgi:hypothetical protein
LSLEVGNHRCGVPRFIFKQRCARLARCWFHEGFGTNARSRLLLRREGCSHHRSTERERPSKRRRHATLRASASNRKAGSPAPLQVCAPTLVPKNHGYERPVSCLEQYDPRFSHRRPGQNQAERPQE